MFKENRPEHQHFIPRSYLKYFARHIKKKRFVEVVQINSGKVLNVSTRDMCVNSGLYTLPKTEHTDPYDLEKFYAEHIDAVYPEVYLLLTNKEKVIISNSQKHKIINTVLSLYFRTPKLLNALNNLTDRLIDRALELTDKKKDEINIDIEGRRIKFARSEAGQIKIKLKEENRHLFITTHLKVWRDFVNYKYKCGISVFEIEGNVDLITSDNPVSIHSSIQNAFNLFDPTNIIEVPLDRRHYLLIYPNTEQAFHNLIDRSIRDKYFALTTNLQTAKNAESWVIGFPETVKKHLEDQNKFGESNEENLKVHDMIKQRAELMNELLKTTEACGFFSAKVAEKINHYRNLDCFKDSHDIKSMVKELKEQGFLT